MCGLVCSEKGKQAYLNETARDAVQLLLNKLFTLPTIRTQEGDVLAQLPKPTTRIPREKHVRSSDEVPTLEMNEDSLTEAPLFPLQIPQPKPPTKWEQFAAAKGIQKRKKKKLEWDEVSVQKHSDDVLVSSLTCLCPLFRHTRSGGAHTATSEPTDQRKPTGT